MINKKKCIKGGTDENKKLKSDKIILNDKEKEDILKKYGTSSNLYKTDNLESEQNILYNKFNTNDI